MKLNCLPVQGAKAADASCALGVTEGMNEIKLLSAKWA
jgi:hypothetical protein